MKKNSWWKCIILILIILPLCPIVLNCILGQYTPCNIEVVGKEDDWLDFWGGYIGAIIGASVGFVTMWKTIKHNTLTVLINQQENYIKELELSLSKCIEPISFEKIASVALWTSRNAKLPIEERDKILMSHLDSEILKLNDYCFFVREKSNAWASVYDNSKDNHALLFKHYYRMCIKVLINDINAMTDMLCQYRDRQITYEELKEKINNACTGHIVHSDVYLAKVFNAAYEWKKSERDKLERLKIENDYSAFQKIIKTKKKRKGDN